MTLTRLPLPSNPLPDLARCTGLYDLFDSTRTTDHWRARQICMECPLLADCKPPEKIITPPFPGAMGRPSGGAVALAGGTWGGRLFRNGEEIHPPPPLRNVACPLCGARQDQRCTSPAGHTVANHRVRMGPVMCPCGRAPVGPRNHYCNECRAAARRGTYAAREERNPTRDRRAKGAA